MTPRKTATAPELRIPQEMLDPVKLLQHPSNYRRHADDAIADSLREFDQLIPLVVNRGNITGRPYEIVAGHGTVKNFIKEYPGELIQASIVDVDERRARKMLLALNRSHDLGEDSEEGLFKILTELEGDYDGTGYDADDLDSLRSDLTIRDEQGEEPETRDRADKFTFNEPHRSGTRIMVLEFPLDAFKWTQKHLAALGEEFGVLSNVDIVVRLIADKVGEQPPPTELESETSEDGAASE